MNEAPIRLRRETMDMCHKLIPMMNEEEISIIATALNKLCNRLEKEGRVTED
jgi:hypothetical protein